MAQPVFDEHPLEQYLRESGEARENMPGGSSELLLELNQHEYDDEPGNDIMEPSVLEQALLVLSSTYHAYFGRNTDSPFAERFKYDVISSSLLSTSLPLPHPASARQTRSRSLAVPGDLSDRSSVSSHMSEVHHATNPPRSFPLESHHPYWILSLAISFSILLFSTGYYFLGTLVSTAAACITWFSVNDMVSLQHDTTQSSLHTLHELIAAGDAWDSAVQSALTSIEKDEMAASSPFSYSSSGSTSPSSSLRVALNTSLHATQTHCDNVRHLLMALTAPAELVQMAEMYAPPSPSPFMPNSPSATAPGLHGLRPMTLPTSPTSSQYSAESPSSKRAAKRTTWNGFNPSTNGGFLLNKRREKRRSDLSALFRPQSSLLQTQSLPVSPMPPQTPPLQEVAEESESMTHSPPMTSGLPEEDEESTFGTAALALRRKYRSGGLDTLGLLSPTLPTSPVARSLRSSQSNNSLNSGSRFTTLRTPRHDRDRDRDLPIGVNALKNALSRALASKRYACSHLLALRFHDEEYDEAYWEDVSSVMGLLTTTFRDASSNLVEAAEDFEHSNKKYERASPESVKNHERISADLMPDDEDLPKMPRARTMAEIVSFAPIPTHLSRFAVHVDAISAALNDARENLEDCVAEVRRHSPEQSTPRRPTHTRGQSSTSQPGGVEEHPALKAYERLRRELGLALRECERGRDRLLDSIAPPRPSAYFDEEEEDVPALAHDAGASSESDRPEPLEDDILSRTLSPDQAYIVSPEDGDHPQPYTSPFHNVPEQIPPPGIEQVFEAESGNDATFARERSKLTREERIALVKKLRESGGNYVQVLSTQAGSIQAQPTEKTGPGLEVVQELKDVIWKVGERRRKLAEAEEGDSG